MAVPMQTRKATETMANTQEIQTQNGGHKEVSNMYFCDNMDPSVFIARYEQLARFNKWEDEQKYESFSLSLSDGPFKWYQHWTAQAKATDKNFDGLKKAFLERYDPIEANKYAALELFNNRKQQTGESIEAFTEWMYAKGTRLSKTQAQILETVLTNLHPSIKAKVQMEAPKSLQQVVTQARKFQMSVDQTEVSAMDKLADLLDNKLGSLSGVFQTQLAELRQHVDQNLPAVSTLQQQRSGQQGGQRRGGRNGNRRQGQQYRPQQQMFPQQHQMLPQQQMVPQRPWMQQQTTPQQQQMLQRPPMMQQQASCTHCGRSNHILSQCRFRDLACQICSSPSHVKRICPVAHQATQFSQYQYFPNGTYQGYANH